MCELLALRGGERVLDVGTGSGYHAALLSRLCAHVYSVELYPELSASARGAAWPRPGSRTSRWWSATACAGLPEHAPYDAINVAAAARGARSRRRSSTSSAEGGRLVAPVEDGDQRLVLLLPVGRHARRHHARPRALRAAAV